MNSGGRHQPEMTSSTDIAANNAGNVNIIRSNVAVHFSVFRYADSGSGFSGTDYIKLNLPVNVDTVGESQKFSVNVG